MKNLENTMIKKITSLFDSAWFTKNQETDSSIIDRARSIIVCNLQEKEVNYIETSKNVRNYLSIEFNNEEREKFCCLFLDQSHKLIECRTIFYGTVNKCDVYPREILRACIVLNASAIILAHNHPSGNLEPSEADKSITKEIKRAAAMIDVRVLDHFIVHGLDSISFKEEGHTFN